jgi:ubiquinone/menaquinone biosynthesis C-methylase UbiE
VGLQYNLFLTGRWRTKSLITNEEVMNNHIRNLGIEENYQILDFGCGDGTYTFSFARMLGKKGRIFALDSDSSKLEKLRIKTREKKLDNIIQTIHTQSELEIPLDEKKIDLTLLYNVACCVHGKDNQDDLLKLIQDVHRITKKSGRLVINIKGKTIEKRIDNALPLIQEFFHLEEKEMKKYYLENERVRYRFFYYLVKKE